jgi:hypothetical protein
MLSTFFSFRGFARGVTCCVEKSASSLGSAAWRALGVWRGGAMTKRFAGVALCVPEGDTWPCEGVCIGLGVCTVVPCRRLDAGRGLDFWVDVGARKRCGEGVCVGISCNAWSIRLWLFE